MPFELPPWLTETAHPFESFAKGASVGVALGQAFSQNVYRNQAMYVRARQDQQEQELRFRQLAQRDADFSLRSEVARTKMAHDTEDYNTLTSFVPSVSSALTFDELNKMQVPVLHDTQNYLKMSLLLDRTKTEKAMGELARELAPTTNWADPAVRGIILKWMQKAPDISLMAATDHLMGRHQAAVMAERTAARLKEETDSRIAARAGLSGLAERRAEIQEGNLDVRRQEVDQKETRLGLRERYLNERNAVDREEKDVLSTTFDATEKSRLRKLYNLKRREVTNKFYGPNATKAEAKVPEPATTAHDPRVPRAGLKTEDRATNAPPTLVAPSGKVRVISPDGTPGFIPESQLEEALKAGYTKP